VANRDLRVAHRCSNFPCLPSRTAKRLVATYLSRLSKPLEVTEDSSSSFSMMVVDEEDSDEVDVEDWDKYGTRIVVVVVVVPLESLPKVEKDSPKGTEENKKTSKATTAQVTLRNNGIMVNVKNGTGVLVSLQALYGVTVTYSTFSLLGIGPRFWSFLCDDTIFDRSFSLPLRQTCRHISLSNPEVEESILHQSEKRGLCPTPKKTGVLYENKMTT
jgi:hypothetical protein